MGNCILSTEDREEQTMEARCARDRAKISRGSVKARASLAAARERYDVRYRQLSDEYVSKVTSVVPNEKDLLTTQRLMITQKRLIDRIDEQIAKISEMEDTFLVALASASSLRMLSNAIKGMETDIANCTPMEEDIKTIDDTAQAIQEVANESQLAAVLQPFEVEPAGSADLQKQDDEKLLSKIRSDIEMVRASGIGNVSDIVSLITSLPTPRTTATATVATAAKPSTPTAVPPTSSSRSNASNIAYTRV
jgi:hypothetical protein